jgi:hypothetical protein
MLREDHGAAVAGGDKREQREANLDDDPGAQEVSAEALGKNRWLPPAPAAIPGTANQMYTEYQFDFTGTGSDNPGLLAQTYPAEWYLDDGSVVQTGLSAKPEPGSLERLVPGLLMVELSPRPGRLGSTRRRRCRWS